MTVSIGSMGITAINKKIISIGYINIGYINSPKSENSQPFLKHYIEVHLLAI